MNLELLLSIMFFLLTLLSMHIASEINLNSNFSSYRLRSYLIEKEKEYQEFYNWFTLRYYDIVDYYEEEKHNNFELHFDHFCYAVFLGTYRVVYSNKKPKKIMSISIIRS